jgi:DNA-directed RNA polymerase subunit RPC12/RpoP
MPMSQMEHSPYCGVSNMKRNAPMQSTIKAKPTRLRSPERAATKSSFGLADLTASSSDLPNGDENLVEVNLTCKWVLSASDASHDPEICSQTVTSTKELDEHIQKEHANKLSSQQFVCGWLGCNTPFKHRGKLNRHVAGAHSRYHAHHCSHCERTFCTKEQLKNHETTHTGEKKYKCSFCDHTSATKTQHNTHERTHTKEKPYACPYCSHRSGDSSNLSKHIKNKHPDARSLPTGQSGRSRVKVG